MKPNRDFRGGADSPAADEGRKGHKLPPIKKSGKERYELYGELEEEEDFDAPLPRKESVFDYFDDEAEEF